MSNWAGALIAAAIAGDLVVIAGAYKIGWEMGRHHQRETDDSKRIDRLERLANHVDE